MKIECPKCGFRTLQSEEELAKLNHTITCPSCMSTLKIVDGIAYIPTEKAPIEDLKPFVEQPPEFKGDQYYQTHANLENLDPLYSAAVEYIKTCNAITLPMLQRFFDIHEPITSENAGRIYDLCTEKLRHDPDMTVRGLIRKTNVARLSCNNSRTTKWWHHSTECTLARFSSTTILVCRE